MTTRSRSQHVDAVVLRHSEWGEADRRLVLFSRENGKLQAIAKGVRRLHSRKAGHLEPFTRVALQLALGKDFWIVTEARTVEAHLHIREDLLRTGYAAYIIELLDRFTFEEGAHNSLFQLLIDTLKRIDQESDPFLAVRYYEIRLLEILGFRPQLFSCARCGKEIVAEDQFFSAGLGGVLCPDCGKLTPTSRPVSMETLKYLRHFQRSSYKDASRAVLTDAVKKEMESLTQYFFTYLLERALNTPRFLREISGS